MTWRKVDIWSCQNNLCCWRSSGSEFVSNTTAIERRNPSYLEKVRFTHSRDLEQGLGQVYMQSALTRKYPKASAEWVWQFCSLHHLYPGLGCRSDGQVLSALQRAIRNAVKAFGHQAGHGISPSQHISCSGGPIFEPSRIHWTSRMMIYTHVIQKRGMVMRSPLDMPWWSSSVAWCASSKAAVRPGALTGSVGRLLSVRAADPYK